MLDSNEYYVFDNVPLPYVLRVGVADRAASMPARQRVTAACKPRKGFGDSTGASDPKAANAPCSSCDRHAYALRLRSPQY